MGETMAYLLDETDILDGRVKMYRREDSGGGNTEYGLRM
jgi:hypothetical protein